MILNHVQHIHTKKKAVNFKFTAFFFSVRYQFIRQLLSLFYDCISNSHFYDINALFQPVSVYVTICTNLL